MLDLKGSLSCYGGPAETTIRNGSQCRLPDGQQLRAIMYVAYSTGKFVVLP